MEEEKSARVARNPGRYKPTEKKVFFFFKSKSQVSQNWQLTPKTQSNTIFGRCHLGGAGTPPLKFRKGTILEKHQYLSNH